MTRLRADVRGDSGTILILSIGFCVIAMMLVWAVVDASAVFLDRRDLAAAVDGTALAAAQQIDVGSVYATGAPPDLPLDPAIVAERIQRYVAQNYPVAQFPGWRISGGVTPDDTTVIVSGSRVIHLPLFGRLTVTAEASAASRILP